MTDHSGQDRMFGEGDKYHPVTQNGHPLDEVVSALQKSIRRGLEPESLHWALELLPKYHNYLWKRLLVVAVEDIEDYNAIVVTNAAHQAYVKCNEDNVKKKKEVRHRIFVTKVILYLCRATKSRESDHFQHFHDSVKKSEGPREDIPEYALDVHTKTGKLSGKTKKDFMKDEQECLKPKGEDNYYGLMTAHND